MINHILKSLWIVPFNIPNVFTRDGK